MATKTNPLAGKLSELYSIALDEVDIQEALDKFDLVYPTFNPKTLKLHQDLDIKISNINESLLADYETVRGELLALKTNIQSLHSQSINSSELLLQALNNSAEITRLIEISNTKYEMEIRQNKAAIEFIAKYTLTKDEILVLSSTSTIKPAFFDALDRVQSIIKDTTLLFVSDTQTVGVEIMDTMNLHAEKAFEKCYRWIQVESRCLKQESPDLSLELLKGIRALRTRPILFDAFLQDLHGVREKALVNSFHSAVSVGSGVTKPIEFHAHDVLRYVGDLLSWVHQACIAERDLLETLLGLQSSAEMRRVAMNIDVDSPFVNIEGYTSNRESLGESMDKNLAGVGNILKSKISSLFDSNSNQHGIMTCLKISNTVDFYADVMKDVVGESSKLDQCLTQLSALAGKSFRESLQTHANDMRRGVFAQPTDDLLPIFLIRETISQLKEILLLHETSLLDRNSSNIPLIFTSFLDPLVSHFTVSSLGKPDSLVYKLNCYVMLEFALYSFPQAAEHLLVIEREIEDIVLKLTHEQYSKVLMDSGLFEFIAVINENKQAETVLSQDPRAYTNVVLRTLAELDKFLATSGAGDSIGIIEKISSVAISRRIEQKSLSMFLENYKSVHESLLDPKNLYEAPQNIITHSVAEVETLLSLRQIV